MDRRNTIPVSFHHIVTTPKQKRSWWRRLGFGLTFVVAFVLAVPFSGIVGLVILHLLAWVVLLGLLLDGPRPVSVKATFKCFDCQYNQPLNHLTGRCVLSERLVRLRDPACANLRLRVSAVSANV